MKLKIEYTRIFWDSLFRERAMMCANLYCQIWKEPPWLEDFWKSEEVLADMEKQLNKSGSICVFAEANNSQVVGFTWGYNVSQSDARDMCGNDNLDFIFNGGKVFYVDELGVDRLFRNHGIGKLLTGEIIKLAKENGIKTVILRTSILAESAKTVYKEMNFSDLYIRDEKYPDRTYWSRDLV